MILLITFFITLCITSIQTNPLDTHILKEMGIMMGAQMGASFANQAVAKEYEEASTAISTDQTNLNNASNAFFTTLQNIKSSQLQTISNIFSSAQNQVSILQKNQQKELLNIENYIQAVTSENFPLTDYLDTNNIILADQLFANSKMYTPQGTIWRNIFQIGDWMYDEQSDSFWQLKNKPFLTTNPNTQKAMPDDAYKNCIFTEWNSFTVYEISCDITIYATSYPFYVGIIFNKARWISGDTYGLTKYRTLGIYGDINKNISLCFAQQKIQKPATATSPALPIPPLTQIYTDKRTIQNFTLNQKAFDNIPSNGLVFHLKIKPSPTSIAYKIWSKGTQEPSVYTTISTTIQHKSNFITITTNASNSTKYLAENDNDIYLYHGIGFVSPGAIAEFKLKQPQQLVFSAANITSFTNEIETYYVDQKNKSLSKSL